MAGMQPFRCNGNVSSGVTLLLLVVSFLLASTSAQYEVPAFNLGETIPMTVYIRLRRQTAGLLNYIVGNAEPDADAEAARLAALFGGDAAKSTREEAIDDAMVAANIKGATGVLMIDADTDLVGRKHARQTVRLIPPQQAPRFAIDKLVWLPAASLYRLAESQMRENPAAEESELALRMSVGKGFNKETTWVPVVTHARQLRNSDLSILLSPEFQKELEEGAAEVETARPGGTADAVHRSDNPLYYLTRINFFFGFQTGVLNRMTSMRYEFVYSRKKPESLALRHIWDEHRAYNTHLAISICCGVSVVAAFALSLSLIGFRSGKAAKQFKKRTVIVRHRDD